MTTTTNAELFPGVIKIQLGEPEPQTPVSMRVRPPDAAGLASLPEPGVLPLVLESITGRATTRGFVVEIPLGEQEDLYGLGLQLKSFLQRRRGEPGKKKLLRVNSDPVADTGDSHAPVPFYVSSAGYGVLIDTARYATFYGGCASLPLPPLSPEGLANVNDGGGDGPVASAEDLYARTGRQSGAAAPVKIEVPYARGVDLYVFWGQGLLDAIQRYNLFSGGGCLPPRWGLGGWYRTRSDFSQAQVLEMADALRSREIPCDVLGLEPGWQSQSYPCSFVWSAAFPEPQAMISALHGRGYQVNLWTHLFIHQESPIYQELYPLSGDGVAFGGLVPDLALPQVREIIARQHQEAHVCLGVAGYKLDECDNSDFITRSWSFPEITTFPSGLDGEQMHSRLGLLYQETIDGIYEAQGRRTYGLVRSSHALAAPYPFVLYSDLYDQGDFLRGLVNAGFSGLLWTPELRHADGPEDLVRRLQMVICSPLALINSWYIKHPPWDQWLTDLNNQGQLAENREAVEGLCRELLKLRMRLVPYLYAAFACYQREGVPPFRALVLDFPDDLDAREVEDQFMMGEELMVAPMLTGQGSRRVYFPAGRWHDFFTGEVYEGAQSVEVEVPLERFPLFVRSGALLPLAEPTLHAGAIGSDWITVRVYGDGSRGFTLYEDDGATFAYRRGEFAHLHLSWDGQRGEATRTGAAVPKPYRVIGWVKG